MINLDEKYKDKIYKFTELLVFFIIINIILLIFKNCNGDNKPKSIIMKPDNIIYYDTIYKTDTFKIIKYHKPIIIRDTVPIEKIVYLSDTLINTKPFIASLDTAVKSEGIDTISLKYYFPEHIFAITVLKTADTNYLVNNNKLRIIEKPKKFYEREEFGIYTTIIGFLLGIYISK